MTIADRLLILASATGILLFAIITWQPSVNADQVEIFSPLEKKLVSLQQDKKIFITGALGESEINIQQHSVRFISSPCKSKFCIHQGWANHNGDFRACLPNKVSLRLLGKNMQYDSVTF